MALRQILEFPDPRLRTIAKPVAIVDDSIRALVDDMFETMYDAQGIGLAATQVDVHLRVIVIDLQDDEHAPLVMINPEYEVLTQQIDEMQEGCLSVPGFYEVVKRPEHVLLKALDRDGKAYELEATGLLAVCIQHECDHLNGKLFVDHLSNLKRSRIRSKITKQKRVEATT
jgi:peptide deformylase